MPQGELFPPVKSQISPYIKGEGRYPNTLCIIFAVPFPKARHSISIDDIMHPVKAGIEAPPKNISPHTQIKKYDRLFTKGRVIAQHAPMKDPYRGTFSAFSLSYPPRRSSTIPPTMHPSVGPVTTIAPYIGYAQVGSTCRTLSRQSEPQNYIAVPIKYMISIENRQKIQTLFCKIVLSFLNRLKLESENVKDSVKDSFWISPRYLSRFTGKRGIRSPRGMRRVPWNIKLHFHCLEVTLSGVMINEVNIYPKRDPIGTATMKNASHIDFHLAGAMVSTQTGQYTDRKIQKKPAANRLPQIIVVYYPENGKSSIEIPVITVQNERTILILSLYRQNPEKRLPAVRPRYIMDPKVPSSTRLRLKSRIMASVAAGMEP